MIEIVRRNEDHCIAGKEFAARVVNMDELATLRQSSLFRQRLGRQAIHRFYRSACLNSEALAALAPTTRENCLSVLRPHTDEEAVRALPTAVVRLKSTLRCHFDLTF